MYGAHDVRVETVPDPGSSSSTDAVVRVTRACILALTNPGALAAVSVTTEDGFRARTRIEPPTLYLAALADTVAATNGKIALAYPHAPIVRAYYYTMKGITAFVDRAYAS